MSNIIKGPDHPLVNDRFYNWHDSGGWYFGSGDPEFWKFSDTLLKPGGSLLDIGVGAGRASLFFALNGMKVTGIDNDPIKVQQANELASQMAPALPFELKAHQLDALNEPLPEGPYDTVLLSHLVHIDSKQKAFDIFDKALEVLKPGGSIWVRGAGKESYSYWDLSYQALTGRDPNIRMLDQDVIVHPCDCSGEYRVEPTLFFDPLDLVNYFSQSGCQIIHSQTIPTEDKMNIMYGEDYNPEYPMLVGGMVSILAQKKT